MGETDVRVLVSTNGCCEPAELLDGRVVRA
jgi:hypothetical protein